MKFKVIFIIIISFNGLSAWAQKDTLKLNSSSKEEIILEIVQGKDSVLVKSYFVKSDSFSVKSFLAISGKELKLKDPSTEQQFYSHVFDLLYVDTHSQSIDTIKRYIRAHSNDSVIILQTKLSTSLLSETPKGDSSSLSTTSERERIYDGFNWPIWLLAASVAFNIYIALLFYSIRKRKKSSNQNIPEDALVRLSKELGAKVKSNDPDAIRMAILKVFEAQREKIFDVERERESNRNRLGAQISNLEENLITSQKTINEREYENSMMKKKIEELSLAKSNLQTASEKTREYGIRLLDSVYKPLYKTLSDNPDMNPAEAKELVIKQVLIGAFQSFSFFRIQNNVHLEWDEMNQAIFFNREKRYLNLITRNTPLNEVDPVAYYVMDLLKDHNIKELDGVLIFGNKLGDNEKHS